MIFLSEEPHIFVADETIQEIIKPDNPIMLKLINTKLKRNDDHNKIYLPPSVLKILLENNEGETKAQIDNLFESVISLWDLKATIIQELCLTAEMLKKDGKIVLITKNPKLHQVKFKQTLKLVGFSAVLDFDGLDTFLGS